MAEVRWRNGLAVARLRIGLRVLTLITWVVSAVRGGSAAVGAPEYWLAAAVNAGHLAAAVAALLLLRRRWRAGGRTPATARRSPT